MQEFRGRYSTQRLPTDGSGRRSKAPEVNDLGGDAADAGAGQADRARRAGREVENPAADERAAVIDGDDDAAAAMGHPQLGAERQRAVGAVMAF